MNLRECDQTEGFSNNRGDVTNPNFTPNYDPRLESKSTASKNMRGSDSPKITKLASSTIGSPKVRHRALGYIAAKLVIPGDVLYLDNKLCKVISRSDDHITGIEQTKNNLINYCIKSGTEEVRFEMLHPSTYERKVKVIE